ncbi:hypothetical protein R3P38DRAFT_3378790 [Favolaschia claudopus]|uniref:Uncharacterized protein n=1 Tax=Favolaschia claudopus TaxID=2862362 RepID=A0AAV9Z790_9AGAR
MDSDDSEYEALDSTLSGSLTTVVNGAHTSIPQPIFDLPNSTCIVTGGRGGPGGRAAQRGGTGGNGEGPRVYLSSKSTIVNVRAGLRVNDSSTWESLLDSNFRRIPLGDINLERQLYLDGPETDRASFRRKRSSVRIVRSAKVASREFTVAMYQGDNAERASSIPREWKEDVERYMDIRYLKPQFTVMGKLYGIVRCRNLWGAVFHGVDSCSRCKGPFAQFRVTLRLAQSADRYLRSTFGRETACCTVLINPSNGRPCIDLESDHDVGIDYYTRFMGVPYWNLAQPLSPMEILSPSKLTYIVETLTLDQYHEINCALNPGDGICFRYNFRDPSASMAWISQANHIFERLDVLPSDCDRYVVVEEIDLTIKLRRRKKRCNTSPEGYLFLCPSEYLVAGPASVKIPERPWYWSLDPYGVEKLNEEKANELGFPTIQPDITIWAKKWRRFAYNGLIQFHEGKGLDPYSQDVAIELKEPLFELCSDEEPLIVEATEIPFDYDTGNSLSDAFEKFDYDSGSESEDNITSEDGHDMSDVLDSNESEDITSNIEFTSFNETGEYTGQASTSASFVPLVDTLLWPAFYHPADTGLEEFSMTFSSQSCSAWDMFSPTTGFNRGDQIRSFGLYDTPLPQVPTWDSNGPSFQTLPLNVTGDAGNEVTSDSRKRRAEDDDWEYESADRAKRMRLIEY